MFVRGVGLLGLVGGSCVRRGVVDDGCEGRLG